MSHNHNHGHSCEAESADHDHSPEMGVEYSLWNKIDLENLECLNESEDGSGKNVFKPYEDRLDFTRCVESDCDQELLFNIPFTGNVKLKGIIVVGANDDCHPKKLRLFKNREKMTFDDVNIAADQEFDLVHDLNGTIEYNTKVVTFSSVYHLSIHIPTNYGADTTRIYYIGLRGEWQERHHHGVTICIYEARPNMTDHKNPLNELNNYQVQ